eukprot:202450-Chlamydomonas_euryale.AAC.1
MRNRAHAVVAAADDKALEVCVRLRLPCLNMTQLGLVGDNRGGEPRARNMRSGMHGDDGGSTGALQWRSPAYFEMVRNAAQSCTLKWCAMQSRAAL